MIRNIPVTVNFKTTEITDANHTSTLKGGLLNNSTLSSLFTETTLTSGSKKTNSYSGSVVTNLNNNIFTKTFTASSGSYYSFKPTFEIKSKNEKFYTVEESSNNIVVNTTGSIAGTKVSVKSTEGILKGMVVSTQNNSTIADTNYVKVVSIDGPKQLTISSGSFSAAAGSSLQFKSSSSDGKLFVKTFTISYNADVGRSLLNNDIIDFKHATSSLPAANVNSVLIDKFVRDISINTLDISHNGEQRTLQVLGDASAVFSLTITKLGEAVGSSSVADKTYDFTSETFTASSTTLANQTIDSTGVYSTDIIFPAITAVDEYQFTITAGSNTTLYSPVFGESPSTPTFSIKQFPKTTVTITLASSENASSYVNSGSNYGVTNVTSTGSRNSSEAGDDFIINWTVTATNVAGNALNIKRQPLVIDFKGANGFVYRVADGAFSDTATIDVETTGHSSISNKISYGTSGLVAGMTLNNIAISSITDSNTIVFASAQSSIANHENLFFDNGGTKVEFSNINVSIQSTFATSTATSNTTSTLTAVSGSSLFGLKTADTAANKSKLIGGFFTKADAETDTVLEAFNPATGAATFSTAQNFQADTQLEFNTSQTAVITATGRVVSYGDIDATITLELDNILNLGTS